MEYIIVSLIALFASGLTMFSGFGLGTLLLPAFALFLPLDLAVAATALVHGANSLLKGALLWRFADRQVVLKFGLPAIGAALVGAWLLGWLSTDLVLVQYEWLGRDAVITPLKAVMATLMLVFAIGELHPSLTHLEFDRRYLPLGGVLSGFFGGLSGHQGALRSAFLAKSGLSAQAFVGTNAIIGLLVDLSRLAVYAALLTGGTFHAVGTREKWLIGSGALAAFAGVVLGKRLLKKVTMQFVSRITGGLLLLVAGLLGSGLV